MVRNDGRAPSDLRPVRINIDTYGYAEGSALIEMGNTCVLCTASVEEGVPQWLRGQQRGWVTAEYALLPRSTAQRTRRERSGLSGRTQEIQRLIGRALRAAVSLEALDGFTVTIDCDVLQADGAPALRRLPAGMWRWRWQCTVCPPPGGWLPTHSSTPSLPSAPGTLAVRHCSTSTTVKTASPTSIATWC